jgi:hypothetical protein
MSNLTDCKEKMTLGEGVNTYLFWCGQGLTCWSKMSGLGLGAKIWGFSGAAFRNLRLQEFSIPQIPCVLHKPGRNACWPVAPW